MGKRRKVLLFFIGSLSLVQLRMGRCHSHHPIVHPTRKTRENYSSFSFWNNYQTLSVSSLVDGPSSCQLPPFNVRSKTYSIVELSVKSFSNELIFLNFTSHFFINIMCSSFCHAFNCSSNFSWSKEVSSNFPVLSEFCLSMCTHIFSRVAIRFSMIRTIFLCSWKKEQLKILGRNRVKTRNNSTRNFELTFFYVYATMRKRVDDCSSSDTISFPR